MLGVHLKLQEPVFLRLGPVFYYGADAPGGMLRKIQAWFWTDSFESDKASVFSLPSVLDIGVGFCGTL